MVNIWYEAEDFIKICEKPEYYFSLDLQEIPNDIEGESYPAGKIGDVKCYFGHETNFETAKKKWKRGCKAFFKACESPHEICVIMNDRNLFTPNLIGRFDSLPYQYKVLYTHDKHEEKSTFYMKGEDNLPYVNIMTSFENYFSCKKRLDRFDFYQWFYEILISQTTNSTIGG